MKKSQNQKGSKANDVDLLYPSKDDINIIKNMIIEVSRSDLAKDANIEKWIKLQWQYVRLLTLFS